MSFQKPLMNRNYAVNRLQSTKVSYQNMVTIAMQIKTSQNLKSEPRTVSTEKKAATIVKSNEKKNS